MAILKSKDELRSILFYNRYIYRASFKGTGLIYTRYANSLEQYNEAIRMAKEYSTRVRLSRYGDRREYWDSVEFDFISQYLSWKEKHRENVIIRLEHDSVSVFFNEMEVLDDLDKFIPEINLTKINLQATGKMFFKRTPKYSYRMYFKQNIYKFSEELDSFIVNHAGNKDISFSKSLLNKRDDSVRKYLHTRLPYYYFNHRGFVDYNNESTLTLLHMYFSGAIGKVYKLEKEPE